MLAAHVSVVIRPGESASPLSIALLQDDLVLARHLLEVCRVSVVTACFPSGRTPLHIAIDREHFEIIPLMVAALPPGALAVKDSEGVTPLMLAMSAPEAEVAGLVALLDCPDTPTTLDVWGIGAFGYALDVGSLEGALALAAKHPIHTLYDFTGEWGGYLRMVYAMVKTWEDVGSLLPVGIHDDAFTEEKTLMRNEKAAGTRPDTAMHIGLSECACTARFVINLLEIWDHDRFWWDALSSTRNDLGFTALQHMVSGDPPAWAQEILLFCLTFKYPFVGTDHVGFPGCSCKYGNLMAVACRMGWTNVATKLPSQIQCGGHHPVAYAAINGHVDILDNMWSRGGDSVPVLPVTYRELFYHTVVWIEKVVVNGHADVLQHIILVTGNGILTHIRELILCEFASPMRLAGHSKMVALLLGQGIPFSGRDYTHDNMRKCVFGGEDGLTLGDVDSDNAIVVANELETYPLSSNQDASSRGSFARAKIPQLVHQMMCVRVCGNIDRIVASVHAEIHAALCVKDCPEKILMTELRANVNDVRVMLSLLPPTLALYVTGIVARRHVLTMFSRPLPRSRPKVWFVAGRGREMLSARLPNRLLEDVIIPHLREAKLPCADPVFVELWKRNMTWL